MFKSRRGSRREFVRTVSLAAAGTAISRTLFSRTLAAEFVALPLEQFEYGDVSVASDLHEKQLEQMHSLLMS